MFRTIYDLAQYYSDNMSVNETLTLTESIQDSEMDFHLYKLPDTFTFDSQQTVNDTLSLCAVADTNTQVLIGKTINIDQDVILIPPYRCKGLIIFCEELNNLGTISMTARGAKAVGQNIYLYLDEVVPATGASGGGSVSRSGKGNSANGNPGAAGTNRRTGGGASGGCTRGQNSGTSTSGAGSAGTSYSGGTGGGGAGSTKGNATAGAGAVNGGAGGNGAANSGENGSNFQPHGAGGGAGNPGGNAARYNTGAGTPTITSGGNGTGGLIIIYCKNLFNNEGDILANGMNGGSSTGAGYGTGGGASGGGSINIFYNGQYTEGTITANGGTGGTGNTTRGGDGGNGSITLFQLTHPCTVNNCFQNMELSDYDIISSYELEDILDYNDHVAKPFSGFTFNHYTYEVEEDNSIVLTNYYDRNTYALILTNGMSNKYSYLYEEEGEIEYLSGSLNNSLLKFKNWISDSGTIYKPYLKKTTFKMGPQNMYIYPDSTTQDRVNSNIYKNIFEYLLFELMDYQKIPVSPYKKDTIVYQYNHGFSLYDVVLLNEMGLYEKAIATEDRYMALGIITEIINVNQFVLTMYGPINVTLNNYSSDSGILYLSDQTAGTFCTYEELITDFYVPIGFYTDNTVTINILDASMGETLKKYQETIYSVSNISTLTDTEINNIITEVLNNA